MASLIEGLAGQQHGSWSFDQMLGTPGSFAVVYAATPTAGGPQSALKLLKPERAVEFGVTDEFIREGELLIDLQAARNVVAIHEANQSVMIDVQFNGQAVALPVTYHRLEKADGCLDEVVVSQHQPGYWQHAIDLFRDVVAGVHQMHLTGIVHRDLKSSNVLLFARRPVGERAQVSDLGRSARLADLAAFPAQAYVFGRGDPSCAPPELIYGLGIPDRSAYRMADLYLLGSVLCELATGQPATSLLIPNWQAVSLGASSVPRDARDVLARAAQATLRPQVATTAELIRSIAPPAIRTELATLFAQLCDPDPTRRNTRQRRDRNLPHTDLAWLLRRVHIIQRQLRLSTRAATS